MSARHVQFEMTFSPDIVFRPDAYPHWVRSPTAAVAAARKGA